MKETLSKKMFPILIVLTFFTLSGITFFAIKSQLGLPKDAFSTIQNPDTGTAMYIINEKYNILNVADPQLFSKPYCQSLADSRIITAQNTRQVQNSDEKLVETSKTAGAVGDGDFQKTIEKFISLRKTAINKGEKNLSEEELNELATSYNTIETFSNEKCGFSYSPQANPKIVKKITEEKLKNEENENAEKFIPKSGQSVFGGAEWDRLSTEEKAKVLQEAATIAEVTAPYAGISVPVDSGKFTKGYCQNLQKMSTELALGGTYEDLDESVVRNFQAIVDEIKLAEGVSDRLLAYENYLKIYKQVGRHFYISHLTIAEKNLDYSTTYNTSLQKVNEFSQPDCGVDMAILQLPE